MRTNLLPSPKRLEAIDNTHILKQIGKQPQTRRKHENRNAEQDQPKDSHSEEQSQQNHQPNTQIPHTLPHNHRPQREQHDGENTSHNTRSHRLGFPLWPFVQPHVVHHRVGFLVLFDLDVPESLHTVLGLRVVVPGVRVVFCDA